MSSLSTLVSKIFFYGLKSSLMTRREKAIIKVILFIIIIKYEEKIIFYQVDTCGY
jgi:hypothetical protein